MASKNVGDYLHFQNREFRAKHCLEIKQDVMF